MSRSFKQFAAALGLAAITFAGAVSSANAAGSGEDPLTFLLKEREAAKENATAKGKQASRKSSSRTKSAKAAASKTKTKSGYTQMIRKAAKKHGVPVEIAKAVVQVESNFNPRARGAAGEVGLMQIKPATARGMGYRGSTKALYQPETNLEWGMKYLAGAHQRANGDVCGTILRYNAGHYAKRMNPISRRYCTKVKRILASS